MTRSSGFWLVCCGVVAGVLAGCAGAEGNPRFVFRVTDEGGGAVAYAIVKARVLDTNLVPLPVTDETLDELFRIEDGVVGVTNADGEATLALFEGATYSVEVVPPMFSVLVEEGPGRRNYVLRPPFGRLEAWEGVDGARAVGYGAEFVGAARE